MTVCPRCQFPNDPARLRCYICAEPLPQKVETCPKCGASILPGDRCRCKK